MNPADIFGREENPVVLQPGEVLFRAGETGDCMYVLLDGTLDVLVQEQVVERSQRGAILGELALIDQSPRGATVVAATASQLARVDARRFHRLIQQNSYFAMHVMKELADRIRSMNVLLAKR